jgi:hypothetical protein
LCTRQWQCMWPTCFIEHRDVSLFNWVGYEHINMLWEKCGGKLSWHSQLPSRSRFLLPDRNFHWDSFVWMATVWVWDSHIITQCVVDFMGLVALPIGAICGFYTTIFNRIMGLMGSWWLMHQFYTESLCLCKR